MYMKADILDSRSSFFNEANEAFFITDEYLNILDANLELERVLKRNRDQIIGKNLCDINPDLEKTERYKKYLEVLRTGKSVTINEIKVNPVVDSEMKIAQIRIFKVKKGLAITALDITNITNTKHKLQTTKEDLLKTNKNLTKKNNDLEEFSYIVAHDLKGPINNLKVLLELLSNKKTELHKNEHYNKLIKIVDQLNKNTYSLNNIIALKYFLQEKKEQINFEDIFNNVVDDITNSIKDSNTIINTNFSECSEVNYPPDQLHKIFFHLINNSINFRNSKTQNVINISTHKEKGKVLLIISDNGIGFNQSKNVKKIFKIYHKENNSSEGLGIGLYIIKSIIDFHHGKIKVKSKVNEGTTFKLTLM